MLRPKQNRSGRRMKTEPQQNLSPYHFDSYGISYSKPSSSVAEFHQRFVTPEGQLSHSLGTKQASTRSFLQGTIEETEDEITCLEERNRGCRFVRAFRHRIGADHGDRHH